MLDAKSKLQRNLAAKRFGRRPTADSQCGRILDRLRHGPITSDQIRGMGVRDATTRIWDLRNLWGVAIRTDENKASGIATYTLALEPLQAEVPKHETPFAERRRVTGLELWDLRP